MNISTERIDGAQFLDSDAQTALAVILLAFQLRVWMRLAVALSRRSFVPSSRLSVFLLRKISFQGERCSCVGKAQAGSYLTPRER